jgi:hypothetical protein
VGVRITFVQVQRRPIRPLGLDELMPGLQRHPQVVVRLRELRPGPDRPPQHVHRLVQSVGLEAQDAEQVQGVGVVGLNRVDQHAPSHWPRLTQPTLLRRPDR